jgi:hypothetical protein
VKQFVFAAAACSALLLNVFVGAARSDAASSAAPTPVPYATPDFSSMQIFLGTWTCHQALRGKIRPDTSTTTMGLNGQYMVTHDVAPPFDKYRTQAVVSDSYFTYNPINHLWVTVGVDNFGGYSLSTSPGWNGNTLTTTTKVTNDGSTGSDVLTKISATQTTDASVSTDAKGNVTRTTTTCTKTG